MRCKCSLKTIFLTKYAGCGKVLDYFREATGSEPTWSNINKVNIQLFVDHIKRNLSPNAAKSYASKLRAVINMYGPDNLLSKESQRVLSLKRDTSQHVYLSDNEIIKLIEYTPKSDAEHLIKNQFLIGCLSGARHSDYVKFTTENISGKELRYVSLKTRTNTIVPVSMVLKRLIKENQTLFPGKNYTDVYFNKVIKKICKAIGICKKMTLYVGGKWKTCEKWEFVSSHTARRSFATNLYLNRVDVFTISKFCGHSSVDMTSTYICCGPRIDKNVKKYFQKYDDERLLL